MTEQQNYNVTEGKKSRKMAHRRAEVLWWADALI